MTGTGNLCRFLSWLYLTGRGTGRASLNHIPIGCTELGSVRDSGTQVVYLVASTVGHTRLCWEKRTQYCIEEFASHRVESMARHSYLKLVNSRWDSVEMSRARGLHLAAQRSAFNLRLGLDEGMVVSASRSPSCRLSVMNTLSKTAYSVRRMI